MYSSSVVMLEGRFKASDAAPETLILLRRRYAVNRSAHACPGLGKEARTEKFLLSRGIVPLQVRMVEAGSP